MQLKVLAGQLQLSKNKQVLQQHKTADLSSVSFLRRLFCLASRLIYSALDAVCNIGVVPSYSYCPELSQRMFFTELIGCHEMTKLETAIFWWFIEIASETRLNLHDSNRHTPFTFIFIVSRASGQVRIEAGTETT